MAGWRAGQQRESYKVIYGMGHAADRYGHDVNDFQDVDLPYGTDVSIAHVEVGHDHTILIDCMYPLPAPLLPALIFFQ